MIRSTVQTKFLFCFTMLSIIYIYLNYIIVYKNQVNELAINEQIFDFEGFDNQIGVNKSIIPNIVHLLFLKQANIKFYQLVNILSIYYNHKPDYIYFHCDDCNFKGKYFETLKKIKSIWSIIKLFRVPSKVTIFGVNIGWIHHRADVLRLEVLMNFGGIYFDNDMFIVNSLKKYLNYEMVVSWDDPRETLGIGNQIFIAHKNARFLRACFDSYRYNYTPSEWYYNAGQRPAEILRKHGYLAYAVKIKLGAHMLFSELYEEHNWKQWRTLDSIHLLINHRSYLDANSTIKEFNETNIWTYNRTYGIMVRSILRRANLYLPKKGLEIKDKLE